MPCAAALRKNLREARDHLQTEVEQRTQQASLLDLTHDSIFVRSMDFHITYWNLGAQELYGWTPEDAIGKESRQLLRTVQPIPLNDLRAELLRTGRWDGELERTKADGTQVVVASRWSLRRDEQGQAVAILETSNDITDRKRREDEIQSLNQQLARRSQDLESINKERSLCVFGIARPASPAPPHGRAYGAAPEKNNHRPR